jgi:3-deoxy-D-manno-octulosonate 8-phosphate phosphatase (KDO 8-P phosphatase)
MKAEDIKLVVCDVDGTLTDGGMYVTEYGDHFKRFNAKDGMAVKILKQHGIDTAFLSHSSFGKMIRTRAKMIGVELVYVGKEDKVVIIENWIKKLGIELNQVVFIGDDINDIGAMKATAMGICPADAVASVLKQADHILNSKGGDACLREFVDDYLKLEPK